MSDMGNILVCCNKAAQSGCLKHQNFIVSYFWRPEIMVKAWVGLVPALMLPPAPSDGGDSWGSWAVGTSARVCLHLHSVLLCVCVCG